MHGDDIPKRSILMQENHFNLTINFYLFYEVELLTVINNYLLNLQMKK
jgi:hypothetical protein